jgi:thiamine kinase-like enzyme
MKPHKRTLLLIPSAKLAPTELQSEFGSIPTAMIPLGNQPAIERIIDSFALTSPQAVVATHECKEEIEKFVQSKTLDIQIVDVGHTKSLGETIFNALETCLLDDGVELVINFADTVLLEEIPTGDSIVYSSLKENYRWTTFEKNQSGELSAIYEKNTDKAKQTLHHVFVGVFRFSLPRMFCEFLAAQLKAEQSSEVDPFYRALVDYYSYLTPEKRQFFEVESWVDLGHVDTYNKARALLFKSSRHFNTLKIDYLRGTVVKKSAHVEKFVQEIKWYLEIPPELKYLTPRIFNYSLNNNNAFVEMEYYSYPVLSDLYLYGKADLGRWHQIFESIQFVLNEMKNYRHGHQNSAHAQKMLKNVYETKTLERIQSMSKNEIYRSFSAEELVINNKKCFGISHLLANIGEVLRESQIYEDPSLSVIHGDLCLSNILFDRSNNIIRLIDPRGSFGEAGIYGDPRYDLAKLAHSIDGNYDFTVNGIFDSKWEGSKYSYVECLQDRHFEVKDLFRKMILPEDSQARMQIRLIEGLLFISMVPLHADRPRCQEAFLAKGLELYTQTVEELNLAITRNLKWAN